MHFMSIEVSTHEFFFPPDEPSGPDDFGEQLTREIEAGSMTESPRYEVQFIHIHLDLELLWWVVVWIAFTTNSTYPSSQTRRKCLISMM
jgi:hypothetical protein